MPKRLEDMPIKVTLDEAREETNFYILVEGFKQIAREEVIDPVEHARGILEELNIAWVS